MALLHISPAASDWAEPSCALKFVQKCHLMDDRDLKKRENKESLPSVKGDISQDVIELGEVFISNHQQSKSSKPHLVHVGLLISHIFHSPTAIISCIAKQHTHDTCDDYSSMGALKETKWWRFSDVTVMTVLKPWKAPFGLKGTDEWNVWKCFIMRWLQKLCFHGFVECLWFGPFILDMSLVAKVPLNSSVLKKKKMRGSESDTTL